MNRITDKRLFDRGIMQWEPGTTRWSLVLDLPPALQASYGFAVQTPHTTVSHPPAHNSYPLYLDVHNELPPVVFQNGRGLSQFRGALAPAQPGWDIPVSHGQFDVSTPGQVFSSDANLCGPRPLYGYLPASCCDGNPAVAALMLLDADVWFGFLDLASAFDRAISSDFCHPLRCWESVVSVCLTERLF